MDNSWTRTSLGDICMFRAGTAFPKQFQGEDSGEIPFIKVSDLKHSANSLYIRHSANWVDMSTVEHLKASLLHPGAIVFAKIGEGLKAERFRLVARATCIDNNLMGAIPQGVNAHFLYYLMVHTGVAHLVEGSALPYLRQSDLERIPVCVPPNDEQRRIAGVLGALDDKIESNRRIAVKCDEVASELFGQAASMNQKLDEVSEVRMGVSPPGFSYNETGEGIAFFQGVRDFSYLHPVARVYTNAPKRLAKPGDILFSVRAPVGRLNIADSTCCIGRGLAAITSNRSAICLFALRAAAAEWEKFSAEGTVFGAVNQKSLKSTLIPWPDPVAEEELEYQLSSLVALASQSERGSISLSKLRDALLPELMSGRMRVDEAGRLVSEALDEEVADV